MEFKIIEGSNYQGMHLNMHIQHVPQWVTDFCWLLNTVNKGFTGSVRDGRLVGNSSHVK